MHNIINILKAIIIRLLMSEKLKERVLSSLKKVYDPELGRSIVDLNMVKNIIVDKDGKVTIEMTLTTPFCPLMNLILAMAKKAAEEVEGVSEAKVKVIGYELPSI